MTKDEASSTFAKLRSSRRENVAKGSETIVHEMLICDQLEEFVAKQRRHVLGKFEFNWTVRKQLNGKDIMKREIVIDATIGLLFFSGHFARRLRPNKHKR